MKIFKNLPWDKKAGQGQYDYTIHTQSPACHVPHSPTMGPLWPRILFSLWASDTQHFPLTKSISSANLSSSSYLPHTPSHSIPIQTSWVYLHHGKLDSRIKICTALFKTVTPSCQSCFCQEAPHTPFIPSLPFTFHILLVTRFSWASSLSQSSLFPILTFVVIGISSLRYQNNPQISRERLVSLLPW